MNEINTKSPFELLDDYKKEYPEHLTTPATSEATYNTFVNQGKPDLSQFEGQPPSIQTDKEEML